VKGGVKLIGLWEMLAMWIGDWDCLGQSGKNAGYILIENCDALTFKIDAGDYGHGFSTQLTKNIHVSPQPGHIIHFDSIAIHSKYLTTNTFQLGW